MRPGTQPGQLPGLAQGEPVATTAAEGTVVVMGITAEASRDPAAGQPRSHRKRMTPPMKTSPASTPATTNDACGTMWLPDRPDRGVALMIMKMAGAAMVAAVTGLSVAAPAPGGAARRGRGNGRSPARARALPRDVVRPLAGRLVLGHGDSEGPAVRNVPRLDHRESAIQVGMNIGGLIDGFEPGGAVRTGTRSERPPNPSPQQPEVCCRHLIAILSWRE